MTLPETDYQTVKFALQTRGTFTADALAALERMHALPSPKSYADLTRQRDEARQEREQLRADLAEALEVLQLVKSAANQYDRADRWDRAAAVLSKHAARAQAVRIAHGNEPNPQGVRPQKAEEL